MKRERTGAVFASKHLYIDWGAYNWRMRKWRLRHNRRVHNMYLQIGSLEVTVWYR
jgi:hypothetical protein